ncbi:MAG: hypothetical protein KBB71_12120 [Lentimicrobiaceae bacterium]|nr:hypothetical protein [Lentimicrobiaceae bacterium]
MTNSRGFTGLPGGFRYYDDVPFLNRGYYGSFWSSLQGSADSAWIRGLHYNHAYVGRGPDYNKKSGFSVRCLQD